MNIRAFSDNMSTNKESKKPQYKDYVQFLDTYKNGKKEESTSYSLTNSSNNSSSSINSDYLSEPNSKGFKEYLEKYENKRFSSVKPTFLKKNSIPDNKKMVKTEIFININNDQKDVNDTQLNSKNCVNKISKTFEKNSNSEIVTKTVSSKVNKYSSQQSETESDVSEQKKISVEEISKKFQTNGNKKCDTLETKKTTLKKQDSIKEKSRIFENNINEINSTKISKSDETVKQNNFKEHSEIKKHAPPLSVKPPAIKVEVKHKSINGLNGFDSSKVVSPSSLITNNQTKIQETVSSSNGVSPLISVSSPNCTSTPSESSPPSEIAPTHLTSSYQQNVIVTNFHPPVPPPLPVSQTEIKEKKSLLQVESMESTSLSSVFKTNHTNSATGIPAPPPPPLPPNNFSSKLTSTSPSNKQNNTNGNKKKVTGYNTLPRMQNNKLEDAADGIPVPTLDKNDPRVKKLVYSALRDMYGTYHNKANDYLATLPKNRVRKNNGLDSIINSIA